MTLLRGLGDLAQALAACLLVLDIAETNSCKGVNLASADRLLREKNLMAIPNIIIGVSLSSHWLRCISSAARVSDLLLLFPVRLLHAFVVSSMLTGS